MKAPLPKVHPDFRLNGLSFSEEELAEVAYSLIKEGEDFEIALGDFLLDWLSASEEIEIHTSGSTGPAKYIKVRKIAMYHSARATATFFGLEAKSTALCCLPLHYIAGKMMLVRALTHGWHLDCVEPNSEPLQHTNKNYDFTAMVPLQAERSLEKLYLINTLIVGGAAINPKLRSKLAACKTKVFETFGMTETLSHIALKRINSEEGRELNFKALPEVSFAVDERGCLTVTAPKITDTIQITNDLVQLVSETEFHWLGRIDSVVNSGGVKLFPEQIELKLSEHINVPFFLGGMPDETLGEKLVLVLEGEVDVLVLSEDLKKLKNLEPYELPKELFTLPIFERSKSGKIQRHRNLKKLSAV